MVSSVIEAATPKASNGARSGGRVDQNRKDRPVAKTDNCRGLYRGEQLPRALHPDLGRLAFHHLIPFAANRKRRVEHHRVPRHQRVEEMPDRGEMLLAGRDARVFL
jgi:hypothetical protein